MAEAHARTLNEIMAQIDPNMAGSGRTTGCVQLGSGERSAMQEGARDMGQTLVALKALNAALIVQNCILKAALRRQVGTAGTLTGDLHSTDTPVPTFPAGVALRLVTTRSQSQKNRHLLTQSEICLARLTPRQTQVMDLVLAGHPSKNIAADLNICQRTVENHRAAIMQRTGATSLPALARMAVGAAHSADRRGTNCRQSVIGG